MRSFLLPAILLCLGVSTACPGSSPPGGDTEETRLHGRAPLNAGGEILVVAHDDAYPKGTPTSGESGSPAGILYKGKIDEAGHFDLGVWGARGRFTLIAKGGKYVEPSSGTVVDHSGQFLRAALFGVEAVENREVAITPWTEIVYAGGGLDRYSDNIKALSDTLSCQNRAHSRLLEVPPALPSEGIQSISSASLSYLYLGALSQLSDDLSLQLGVQGGKRITSMWLTKVLAEDFADGRIDGKNQSGSAVYLHEGRTLPPDVLRQRFAQAARTFLRVSPSESRDWGNCSSIGESAVLDFLKCVSEGSDLRLGASGAVLDLNPPALEILTPKEGAYLASPQELVCEAKDASGLASLKGSLWRGGTDIPNSLGAEAVDQGADSWRWNATVRIDQIDTGDASLRCEASDIWGNTRVLTRDFRINRGLITPKMTLSSEDLNAVTGNVRVACECFDDQYNNQCELLNSDGEEYRALGSSSAHASYYEWNTRAVIDGAHVLTCANWTEGLSSPLIQSVSARVKNHQPGSATGAVYLDTLVRHVTVNAYAFKDGHQGAELGTTEAPEGSFVVPITNEYRGPVLLVAENSRNTAIDQPQAKYRSIPLNADLAFGGGKLMLLIDHYEPGETPTRLSINIASTMAVSLSQAMWKAHAEDLHDFRSTAQRAHHLVAEYLNPTRPFDPRYTRVANLSSVSRHDDNELTLALIHVGVSRLAVEYSIENCQRRTCITPADVVEAMRRDLSDGQLNGLDPNENRVALGYGAFLGGDFFRIELARAIRRWLDGSPLADDGQPTLNPAELRTREYVRGLQDIAAHDSPLFGGRPGARYDDDGPTMSIRLLALDGQPAHAGMLSGKPINGVVLVDVEAEDDTGVLSIVSDVDEVGLATEIRLRDGMARFRLDSRSFSDGDHELVVVARDVVGNETSKSFNLRFENSAPDLMIDPTPAWVMGDGGDGKISRPIRIKGQSKKQLASFSVSAEGAVPVTGELDDGAQEFETYFIVPCDKRSAIRVEVQDLAGNKTSRDLTVACDNTPPSIQWEATLFEQENEYVVRYDQSGTSITYVPVSNNAKVILAPADSAPTISKYVNRLDLIPEAGRTIVSQNIPVVSFSVSDLPGAERNAESVYASREFIDVQYRYLIDGAEKRSWTDLPKELLNKVPVSYQNLHADLATPSRESVHSIEVRATDAAGNSVISEFKFHIEAKIPPIAVRSCGAAVHLAGTKMSSLTRFYNQDSADVAQASLSWASDLPPGSLAPQTPLAVHLTSGMLSRIEAIDAISSGEWREERRFRHNACIGWGWGRRDQHWYEGDGNNDCNPGEPPGWIRAWTRGSNCSTPSLARNWTCNQQDTPHDAVFHVQRSSGQRFERVNNFALQHGESLTAITAVHAPRLIVSGQFFNGAPFSPDGHWQTFVVDHRDGLQYYLDQSGGAHGEKRMVRRFKTVRFMRSVALDVRPTSVAATHPLYGAVDVQYLDTCPSTGFTHMFD